MLFTLSLNVLKHSTYMICLYVKFIILCIPIVGRGEFSAVNIHTTMLLAKYTTTNIYIHYAHIQEKKNSQSNSVIITYFFIIQAYSMPVLWINPVSWVTYLSSMKWIQRTPSILLTLLMKYCFLTCLFREYVGRWKLPLNVS